ncbi:MAG: hypothetical protein HUJ95_01180 [Bacteroidales bacterium]|nr:hypothetical protein [Bacteroidales bacterium]
MATKKVQIPIDEHETFVSVAKSFAADGSASEKLASLYELQQVDSKIDEIIQLRGELPQEVESLEKAIVELNAKVEATEQLIAGYNQNIKMQQHDIEEMNIQSQKYQEQLGQISNSREYDSLSKEVENLDLARMLSEKTILEIRDAIAKQEDRIENLNAVIEVKKGDLAAKQEELAKIVESTSVQEQKLVQERNGLTKAIDARTISAYERIRATNHNHLAVVKVYNGDSCGGCFGQIPPQRLIDIASNKKMIICEYCGRIIVNPEKKSE